MEARGLKLGAIGIALLVDIAASFVLGALGGAVYGLSLGVSGAPRPDPRTLMTSEPILWVMLLAGLGGSAIGGFVAARLARHAPLLHGCALAIASLALGLLLSTQGGGAPAQAPAWYEPAGIVGALLATLLGALLVRREDVPRARGLARAPH
jgi:hypothetical protein